MREDDEVIQFWQNIIETAVAANASDIHIEPDQGASSIRLRVDGHLSHLIKSPALWHERITTRIKILSRLDISEKRLPQDGQMLSLTLNRSINCRVSTLPTLNGEKIVIRLLNKNPEDLHLNKLGLQTQQLLTLQKSLDQPQGFILVTGPTGSGKTIMFSYMVKNHYQKGGRTLILTHRKELLNQSGGAFKKFGLNPTIGFRDKKYYYLRFKQKDSRKLIEVIKPFIPSCMNYKIGETKNGC